VIRLGSWTERLGTGRTRLEGANVDRGRLAGEREELVLALNKARRSPATTLVQRAVERDLPLDWPGLLFCKEACRPARPAADAPPAEA
jgi:hypothetical protein